MGKQSLRFFLAALTVTGLTWGGSALAYLSPDYFNQSYAPGGVNYPWMPGPGDTPDYLTTANWAYSPPLRKFVDTLPGLTPAGANNLGQYIPVAVPDITTYPGSDYYEIELVQWAEQMHTDLANPTTLRGYHQVNSGTDTAACSDPVLGQPNPCTTAANTVAPDPAPHYLGPLIVSQKDRPVRVKFINRLPTGTGGELFVPVDQSIMGAGPYEIDYDPVTNQAAPLTQGVFAQNRATLHLHGGRTPWISDGTPHQWITPPGEDPNYPQGVSVVNVPDMPDPGPGAQTFYWTNQQAARLMFYHDHAWGITRLNVYVGEAAGYLIRDQVEQSLVDAGILPVDEIPLIIQDKTYVDGDPASPNYVRITDPTWRWGTGPVTGQIQENGRTVDVHQPKTGDFWWPHIYMPAQNPFDITGVAPMGRWAYGPYFWPPTNNPFQPVPNPYYSPLCNPNDPNTPGSFGGFCQPPEIPGTPNPSWGAEAFMDTPIVNGTAYPTVTLQPKAYRFHVLNGAHDRFLNLSLFRADMAINPNVTNPECANFVGGCATQTEVRMLPAIDRTAQGFPATWPADGRPGGVPSFRTAGPDWIMIGTEGGFLPQPVIVPPHPVDWNVDVTTFNAGNVNKGSLILGPAERADVIVDFSQFAGQTLILYNDAPAPWPALDFHYDYYSGAPDNTAAGGYGPIFDGIGPNIRTIMQIKVQGTAALAYNPAPLFAAFTSASNSGGAPSVFEQGQDTLIVGQGNMNPTGDPIFYEAFPFTQDFSAYNKAYDLTLPTIYPNWGVSRIYDQQLTFYNVAEGRVMTVPMKFKAIQDEQGETFDMYGRMRAALGLELSNPGVGQVNFIVQTYSDPPTEIINPDEIQIWKITHNGVDTHPVHFHLYDVQILNRVGWDGFIRLPDPTELGWKDTIRVSPLEDTIVALRPVTPRVPFGVPESRRPKNPATPLGDTTELSMVDPVTGEAWLRPNINEFITLDWEYVWHCHILSHEENDMMRPQQFQFVEALSNPVSNLIATPAGQNRIDLTWTDPTPVDFVTLNNFGNPQNEIGFRVLRSTNGAPYDLLGIALANATSFSDTSAVPGETYRYAVRAFNAAGLSSSVTSAPVGMLGVNLSAAPAAPQTVGTGVTFTATPTAAGANVQYRFKLRDPANNWTVVRGWNVNPAWSWNTTGLTPGNYRVRVDVRMTGTTAIVATDNVPYRLRP